MNDQLTIILTLFIYVFAVFGIAYLSNLRTKSLDDYVLGGRCLSGPVTALGAGASDMSGWLLMGLPGAAYVSGISVSVMALALCIGSYLNWVIISKRLRVFTEKFDDSLTIPEYIRARFTSNKSDIWINVVIASIFVIFFTIYSSSGLIAGALLIKSTFGISYSTGLILISTVILLYTALGGFLAVNRIDFFQGLLMLFALLVVPITVYMYLSPEKINEVSSSITSIASLWADTSGIAIVAYLAWGLGYFGQPHILVRFMAVRSVAELPMARRICTGWMALSLCGAIAVGLLGRAVYSNSLTDPEIVFIKLSADFFPAVMSGVLLSAILSAIMSTVSALLLMSSSSLISDIYKNLHKRPRTGQHYLSMSRMAVVLVAIFSSILSMDSSPRVLNVVAFAWSGLGASFGPVIIFSLFHKRMSYTAAIAGMLSGATIVLVWNILSKNYFPALNFPGLELLPGFIVSSSTIIYFSKKFPQKDQSILNKTTESIATCNSC